MKWNEKPIVPWRAKASYFEGQLNVYACDELFRMHVLMKYKLLNEKNNCFYMLSDILSNNNNYNCCRFVNFHDALILAKKIHGCTYLTQVSSYMFNNFIFLVLHEAFTSGNFSKQKHEI